MYILIPSRKEGYGFCFYIHQEKWSCTSLSHRHDEASGPAQRPREDQSTWKILCGKITTLWPQIPFNFIFIPLCVCACVGGGGAGIRRLNCPESLNKVWKLQHSGLWTLCILVSQVSKPLPLKPGCHDSDHKGLPKAWVFMGSALNGVGPLGGAWISSNNLVDQNQWISPGMDS